MDISVGCLSEPQFTSCRDLNFRVRRAAFDLLMATDRACEDLCEGEYDDRLQCMVVDDLYYDAWSYLPDHMERAHCQTGRCVAEWLDVAFPEYG